MMEKKNKPKGYFWLMRRLLPMAVRSGPVFFITIQLLCLYIGLGSSWIMMVTQRFFDSVAAAMNLQDSGYAAPIFFCALLGILIIFEQLANGSINVLMDAFAKKMTGYTRFRVHEKAGRMEAIYFEDTASLDTLNKAVEGTKNVFGPVYILAGLLSIYIPYFFSVSIYLFRIKPVLIVIIALIFIPVALNQWIRSRMFKKLEDEAAPIRREMEYYYKCILAPEYYKETRTLGAYSYFIRFYKDTLRLFHSKVWKTEKKTFYIELSLKLITAIGYFGVIAMIVILILHDMISVGVFAAVLASVDTMFALMEEMITIHIGSVTRNLGTVHHLCEFLEAPEHDGKKQEMQTNQGITLRNVTFRYPGAKEDVLNKINLHIKENETVAIVGENGVGKSTLCRLLCGIYHPDTGTVSIGRTDTRDMSMDFRKTGISGVFQRFQKYKATLRENIKVSEMEQELTDQQIDSLLESLDMEMQFEGKGEKGYGTMLAREFGGIDLSLGQWQRIAIARGLFRKHQIIFLDEPTAAIDPVEESKLYRLFLNIAADKTAIIVTHRLGAARMADRILVLADHKIVEDGTHEELIKLNGRYATMFHAQAHWYL